MEVALGGKPALGGAVIIAVEGIDPSGPPDKANPDVTTKVLFPRYELHAELPNAASTKDIDVPAEAAKGTVPKKDGFIVP